MPVAQHEAAGRGQFRQVAGFQVLGPFHALGHADRVVHPQQGAGGDQEQQHEAALPDADHVVEHAEGQRQQEAAEAADHAHQATDHADVVRVVGGDVLEHRRLAQGHEEAQHRDDQGEAYQAEGHRELDLAAYPGDRVAGRRIAEQEGAQRRYAQGPVHHPARAVAVGQPAAEDAEHRRRHRVERGDGAGGGQAQAVDLHQVVRQPQREGDEGAEDEEIVEREAPDAQFGQRRQLLGQRDGAGLAGSGLGIGLGEQDEADAHCAEHRRVHQGGAAPAQGQQQERGGEVGQAGADVAGAEDAQRRALPAGLEPGGGIGRADDEAAARQTHAQRRHQQHREAVGEGQQVHADGGGQHQDAEHPASAVAVCPQAEEDPRDGTGQHRRGHQQAELGVGQAELFADLQAEDREQRPDGKAEGKGQCREAKGPILVTGWNLRCHEHSSPGCVTRLFSPAGYLPASTHGSMHSLGER
ncbi:hypothetical protein D9M71_234660 [compost metagenome]